MTAFIAISRFQPTHPRRCDRLAPEPAFLHSHFNRRTREGCGGPGLLARNNHYGISNHAPAKGATQSQPSFAQARRYFNPRTRNGCDPSGSCVRLSRPYFNPRTRKGCDSCMSLMAVSMLSFHPTHPQRVRPDRCATSSPITNFNPRTREGCDSSAVRSSRPAADFNPRTRKGCDFDVHFHRPAPM